MICFTVVIAGSPSPGACNSQPDAGSSRPFPGLPAEHAVHNLQGQLWSGDAGRGSAIFCTDCKATHGWLETC